MSQSLSPRFDQLLLSSLIGFERGREASEPAQIPYAKIASQVLQLSGFYHSHPGDETPWRQDYAVNAYLAYFLPLNFARLSAVFSELRRHFAGTNEREKIDGFSAISEIWDLGSGPGTTQWVLEEQDWLSPRPLYCVERSREAVHLHERLYSAAGFARWKPEFRTDGKPSPGALGVFSYSFLEIQDKGGKLGSWDAQDFDHLLIVEPSTREHGRALMEWRKKLTDQGFHILAPCTHARECPLLKHSLRDWCHMRVGFDGPGWLQKLEEHLPMKNRTLTYSYLLLSKSVAAGVNGRDGDVLPARVIGDTLEEKGKTRQMICRGEDREFLSWLHRHGEPPRVPRGALIRNAPPGEVKGNELRVAPGASIEWT